MLGNLKIEIKLKVGESEYQFFFPSNSPASEVMEVSKKLFEEFSAISELASQEKLETKQEASIYEENMPCFCE